MTAGANGRSKVSQELLRKAAEKSIKQVKPSFSIGDTGVYSVGSWNVDKVTVGESGQCVPPNVSAAPKPMPVAAPHLK